MAKNLRPMKKWLSNVTGISFITAIFFVPFIYAGENASKKILTEACTVDGHGPYPLKWEACLDLAKNQSMANCKRDLPAKVKVEFQSSTTSATSESAAKRMRSKFCTSDAKCEKVTCGK